MSYIILERLFAEKWSIERQTKFYICHFVEGSKELLSDLYIQNICHDTKGWTDPLVRVFHILMILSGTYSPFLFLYLSPAVSHTQRGQIPEIWIRIAPQRVHDLISMCHGALIGLDTTSEDLKGLKMFLLHPVCFAVVGGNNEALAAERVEVGKITSTSLNYGTKKVRLTHRVWPRKMAF